MNDIKIDWERSTEIIKQIIEYMNKIISNNEILKNKINSIDELGIWKCDSSIELKNRSINMLNEFDEECLITNKLIYQLLEKIKDYKQLDKKIIQSLYEMINF